MGIVHCLELDALFIALEVGICYELFDGCRTRSGQGKGSDTRVRAPTVYELFEKHGVGELCFEHDDNGLQMLAVDVVVVGKDAERVDAT